MNPTPSVTIHSKNQPTSLKRQQEQFRFVPVHHLPARVHGTEHPELGPVAQDVERHGQTQRQDKSRHDKQAYADEACNHRQQEDTQNRQVKPQRGKKTPQPGRLIARHVQINILGACDDLNSNEQIGRRIQQRVDQIASTRQPTESEEGTPKRRLPFPSGPAKPAGLQSKFLQV